MLKESLKKKHPNSMGQDKRHNNKWFVLALATRLDDKLTQVVICQPLVIQHAKT